MGEMNRRKGIAILLVVLICIIALLLIGICVNKNARDEIAHILSIPISGATGTTGDSIGENVVANFNGDTGEVTISSTSGIGIIAINPFKSFVEKYGVTNIKIITFENKVCPPVDSTSLFEGLSELTRVENAQNLNTSNVNRFHRMFKDCYKLESIDVSSWDTQKITDASYMFDQCQKLAEINVSNWNTANVTKMDYMFCGCSSLTTLDVSKWNTGKVWTLYSTFEGCNKLTTLDVSNWNTENVTSMQHVFDNCSNLTTIDVSKWKMGKVTTITFMFNGCKKLTTIDVSKWDTSAIDNMSCTFYNCSGLTTVDVSNWNTENVTTMEHMFDGCGKLNAIDVSSWKTGKVSNFGRIFMGCGSLTEIDVSNWDTGNAWDMECMFHNCGGLTEIDVSKWNTEKATTMYAMFWNCNKLTTLDVSNWNTGKVTNMVIMFEHCSKLRTLEVSNWNTENVTSLQLTFHNCSSLTELNVSKWNTGKVTSLEETFSNCSGLTTLDVSKWNTEKVGNIKGTFRGCRNVTELDVSNWKTEKVTNMDSVFESCNKIAILDVSNWDTSNVTNIHSMFSGCKNLESIDVRNWDTSKVTDMRYLFYYCSSIKKMDLRSFDFSKVTTFTNDSGEIISGAKELLGGCSGINEIWLPAYTSSEVITLPDTYRDADKPEKANIYHTEVNSTAFAEPIHLFRGVFISFNLGIAKNYVLTEYAPYTKTQYCIVEEEASTGGTEGKGKDILPVTTNNYSDTIDKVSILWNENTFESEKGYKFTGWNSNYNNSIMGVPYASRLFSKDITYTAMFEALEVNYTVKHYQEALKDIGEPPLPMLANNDNVEEGIKTRSTIRDGYELVETENLTGIADTQVTPETKNYTGFTAPAMKTVTILGDGSTTVEYFYTRNQYDVILTKDEGIDSVTGEGKYYYEQDVNVKAEVNENYVWKNWTGTGTLNNMNTTFKMPAQDVTLTANSIKKTNIEIYYIDETNDEIIEDKKIVEGYIGKEYEVKPIQIDGYQYSSSSENETGIMTEEPIIIYFKYLKETGLNVKYVDMNTKEEIAEAKHYDCVSTEEYDVTEDYQDIELYTFIKDSGNTKGIMINEGTDVIYYYAYNSNITIKYYDEYTKKEIEDPQIIEGYEGKEYTLEPKEIEGYKLIEIDNPEGTIERDGTEVKYYYAKEITLTIKYIYKNTNEEIKEKKEYTYYSGDTYDLEEEKNDIGEYKYVDTNIGLKGKIESKDITIEIYYEIDNTVVDIEIPQTGEVMIIFLPLIIVIFINIVILFINIARLRKYRTIWGRR